MFDRDGVLNINGLSGSGADWLERYKLLINDGKTIVASPHKVYGPENNDIVLQLRKRNISKVILAGSQLTFVWRLVCEHRWSKVLRLQW